MKQPTAPIRALYRAFCSGRSGGTHERNRRERFAPDKDGGPWQTHVDEVTHQGSSLAAKVPTTYLCLSKFGLIMCSSKLISLNKSSTFTKKSKKMISPILPRQS